MDHLSCCSPDQKDFNALLILQTINWISLSHVWSWVVRIRLRSMSPARTSNSRQQYSDQNTKILLENHHTNIQFRVFMSCWIWLTLQNPSHPRFNNFNCPPSLDTFCQSFMSRRHNTMEQHETQGQKIISILLFMTIIILKFFSWGPTGSVLCQPPAAAFSQWEPPSVSGDQWECSTVRAEAACIPLPHPQTACAATPPWPRPPSPPPPSSAACLAWLPPVRPEEETPNHLHWGPAQRGENGGIWNLLVEVDG